MASACCILCGIPITHNAADTWLREFRAIYTENTDFEDARISGIGLREQILTTAPIKFDKRHDDPGLDPDSTISISLHHTAFRNIVNPDPFYDPDPFRGFAFHPSCWSIITEIFQPRLKHIIDACLSMPCRIGGILDWGHDYAGVFTEQTDRGYTFMDTRYWKSPANDFTRFDPLDTPMIKELLQFGVVLDRFVEDPCQEYTKGSDCFGKFPSETLQAIIAYLPSKDVRSLRCASRTAAYVGLPEAFWATRFQPGHEYEHLFELRHTSPKSWRAAYDGLNLLRQNLNLANRKRIWKLALQFQDTIDQIGAGPCHGRPLKCFFDSTDAEEDDDEGWFSPSCGLGDPLKSFCQGGRALHTRLFETSSDIDKIFVSLVKLGSGLFVSGFRFQLTNATEMMFGYIHNDREFLLAVPSGVDIIGWQLAFHETGVKAIAAVMGDETVSSWIGDYEESPKRLLIGSSRSITTLKGYFDAFKLVSLAIPTWGADNPKNWPVRDFSLWSPEIPPKHMYLCGSQDTVPGKSFPHEALPFSTVTFGGVRGEDLDDLVEVVGWVFDVYRIYGMEFIYTDPSKNKVLGQAGPFDDVNRHRRHATPSDDFRIPLAFDRSMGERIVGINVKCCNNELLVLKIITSLGREVLYPPSDEVTREDYPWVTLYPYGDTIVGFYSTLRDGLSSFGVMSIDSGSEP